MLLRTDVITEKAAREGYGVIASSLYDANSIKYCFEAAHRINSPVIIRASVEEVNINEAIEWVKFYEKYYPLVSIALQTEDVKSLEEAAIAAKAGASGISIASSINNDKLLKEVLRLCQVMNISVETSKTIDSIEEAYNIGKDLLGDIIKLEVDFDAERIDIDNLSNIIKALRRESYLTIALSDISNLKDEERKKLSYAGASKFDNKEGILSTVVKTGAEAFHSNTKPRFLLIEMDRQIEKAYIDKLIIDMKSVGSRSRI